MQITLTAVGQLSEFRRAWCVYSLRDGATAEATYVGMCRLTKLFDAIGCGLAQDVPVIITLLNICPDKITAIQERAQQASVLGVGAHMIGGKHSPVKCIDTGQVWPNASKCAKECDIDPTALSKHLNRKTGFKTVGNKRFTRL